MNKQESIINLHHEHTEWINKLTFYKDDIKVLSKRLEEIVTKNNAKDVLSEVEKFQNQFIIQNDNIDRIKHIINLDEDKIKNEIQSNPVAVDHRKMGDHAEERDLVDTFEKNFNEIRAEFNKFSAKWM
jgi:hypothetical protein